MLDLYENGTIYFPITEIFKSNNISDNRSDDLEGSISFKHFSEKENHVLKINPENDNPISIKIKQAVLREYLTKIEAKSYSMYSVKMQEVLNKDYEIDDRVISDKKYKYCVVITNVKEFLNRITSELDISESLYRAKLIKYYDEGINNEDLDLFNKPEKFSYQKRI